jgi:NNP family nitrate/nitrite transporter-like MFS transporter
MIAAALGVIFFLNVGSFIGFFAMFMALFFFTGVGNSSTFQMIPHIVGDYVPKLMPGLGADEIRRHVERESAAITAFTSAIAAYGAFFIPKAYGSAIAATGSANLALWGFVVFYVICLAVTWVWYDRPGGLLHDIERRKPAPTLPDAQTA